MQPSLTAAATHSALARLAVGLLLLALLAPLAGCSPARARMRADRAAYQLEDQKSAVAGGKVCDYRIGIRPESRMFDPFDPDREPMPPDDPRSHLYMLHLDGKRGARYWRKAPRTPDVENPSWRGYLPTDDQGRLVLDTEAAVLVGRLHDPDYQQELEDLYLSALDVSFERFRFDTQLFGGSSVYFEADGKVASGTGSPTSRLFLSPSSATQGPATRDRWRLQRMTATGGELVVGLANTIVWQFSGPDDYGGTGLLDFALVQPLVRGGGRIRVLERLTVAERTLLSNVRAMERFRREYYLNVVVGRFPSAGPERRGGILGGAGLANFAGVGLRVGGGGGGFGGGQGGGGASLSGAAAAGGYLGLLQTAQVLRNQRSNVAGLRSSALQLEASYQAGRIDRFQVDLARQALFNAQSQLLRAEADFQTSLDAFKVDLGLPPGLELLPQDQLLESFNLLDPNLTALENRTSDFLDGLRAEQAATDTPDGPALVAAADGQAPPERLPPPTEQLQDPRPAEARGLLDAAAERLAEVEADFQRLRDIAPSRKEHILALAKRPEVRVVQIDPRLLDPAALDGRIARLDEDLAAWRQRFESLRGTMGPLVDQTTLGAEQQSELTRGVERLSSELLDLSLQQARARLDAIDLEPTELDDRQALEIARFHRRDWANARTSLVDQWRLIRFNANDLKSGVDVVFSGDMGTVGENPFRLRDTNARLRLGLEFDSPTSRLAERNVYRQSLIEYQQARRAYYRYVDRVHQQLRSTLRQVRLNEVNLELRREAVFVAISQVDLTQLRLREPPKPGETEQFNNTTARDLVQALGDLLTVQNDLLSVWVNNRVQRLNLELDLGVMELDERGVRVPLDQPLALYAAPVEGAGDDVNPTGPLPQLQAMLDGSPAQVDNLLLGRQDAGPSSGAILAEPIGPGAVAPGGDESAPAGGGREGA